MIRNSAIKEALSLPLSLVVTPTPVLMRCPGNFSKKFRSYWSAFPFRLILELLSLSKITLHPRAISLSVKCFEVLLASLILAFGVTCPSRSPNVLGKNQGTLQKQEWDWPVLLERESVGRGQDVSLCPYPHYGTILADRVSTHYFCW